MKTFCIEDEMQFESTKKIIDQNDAYMQYLDTCIIEFEKGFQQILTAIDDRDFKTISEIRHKLYPIFKLFGLEQLCLELKNIDNYLDSYDSQHHLTIKNSFIEIMRQINEEIVRVSNQ
ncbi:MAG: hypothetical protein NWR73_05375 [Flavobacteriales bacterium]|nr:hypothetical protein [Flavobacteriales bacterium]